MKQNHIHKLKRHKYKSGNEVYFCTLNCTFKIECSLAEGLKSICNLCNSEFVMTNYSVKLKYPHCSGCAKHKVKDAEGNVRYIRKQSTGAILSNVAADSAMSLSDRLKNSISSVLEKDEDI